MSKPIAYLILACVAGFLGFGAYSCSSLVSHMRGDDYEGSSTETVDSLLRAFGEDETAATARLRNQLIVVGGTVTRKDVVGDKARINIAGAAAGYVELQDVPMDEAAAVPMGARVAAECRLGGYWKTDVRKVWLRDCRNVR